MTSKSNAEQVALIEHCIHCFDSLLAHFEKSPVPKPLFNNHSYPLFVTWHKHKSGDSEPVLRGCKGTFQPQYMHNGLAEFALISALKDTRFSPITMNEIAHLECSVSLLYAFEECQDAQDWEVGVHGIIIDFKGSDGVLRNATYLPEVAIEQEWTKMEALKSLVRKAGFKGTISQELFDAMKTTRYQSSQSKIHYRDYAAHRKAVKATA
eukprot:TRINITY_DN729_c0_g1_i1.p1 TRINITY_DN729_c0_g1~~TRINITY_DN729_c0_g1_i1.p1  ORF type:complete len:209 (+),score=47.25 TRINITY_DN729_c0_g1_i1:63-689(+)